MELAVEERAFIRPSPAQGRLNGMARCTRNILLCGSRLCNILVETVGVGQSRRSVHDRFLPALMLAARAMSCRA
jgi:LAO/AO transport system kinase